MRLKLIIISIFIITYGIFFYTNTQTKNERIQLVLDKQLDILKVHYDLTMNYFLEDTSSIRDNISNNKKAIKLFSQAQNASKEQRNILRDKLYKLLTPMYGRIHSRGILQFQFVFPNNVSFLRMHKPNKYGDDLTNIRYSFKYANKTKKAISGFEQGRTTHAFRYVFPYFDKQHNHLGAIELSLSSVTLQEKLLYVNKIHSHFLVNKNIFDTKAWETKDLITKYIPSIENKDYMIALSKHTTKEHLKKTKYDIIGPLEKQIADGFNSKKTFSLHTQYKNTMKIISFLPIPSTQGKKAVAYIVSYNDDDNLYKMIHTYERTNIMIFILLVILSYFTYKNLKHKDELNTKNEELQNYLNVMDDIEIGILIINSNFKVEFMNHTMVKWFGDQKNMTCYKSIAGLEDPCPYCKIQNVINLKEKVRYTPTTPDGRTFDIIAAPIKNINGNISKMEIIRDITNEVKATKQLAKSEKMASMGEMIGNIAHQWRQPLSVISTASTGIIMQKEYGVLDEDKLIETCTAINTNAQYLSKTIDDFRNFIKGDRVKEIFNLSDDINSFLNLVEGSIKNHNINMILDIQKDININGYKNELTQCFINIFNNAKDAIKEKITAKDNRLIFISTRQENDKVIITIKDNAGGIPKDIINKIFEPYFTTKHKSQGTGLGLHMTYNFITEGMGGTIEVKNTSYIYEDIDYNGAEFTITL